MATAGALAPTPSSAFNVGAFFAYLIYDGTNKDPAPEYHKSLCDSKIICEKKQPGRRMGRA